MQRARSEAESGVREENELAPKPNPQRTAVEHIGVLTAAELEEIARGAPKRGLQSGAFIKRPDGSSALDWKSFRAPPPPPAAGHVVAPKPPERAELVLADLSLQVDNPFVGSSLLPPPPKKRPWLKPLLVTAAGAALLCAGYAAALYHQRMVAVAALTPAASPIQTHAPAVEQTAAVAVAPALPPAVTPITAVTTHVPVTATASVTAITPQPVAVTAPAPIARVASPATMRAADAKPRRANRARTRARAAQEVAAAPTLPEADAADVVDELVASVPKPAPTALLTRIQVKTGLEAVRSELNTCAAGQKGQIMANVTIAGTGRVSYATIEGDFSGTPQGSCMARALRGAQFPAFTVAPVRVRYPFVF